MKRTLMTAAAMILALAMSGATHAAERPSRSHTEYGGRTNTSQRHYDDHRSYGHSHYYEPSRRSSYFDSSDCDSFDCEPSYCEPTECESFDREPSYCEPPECESFDCEPPYRDSYRRPSYSRPYRFDRYDGDSHFDRDSHYNHERGHTSHTVSRSRGK